MILKDGPLALEEIVDSFAPKQKDQILKTIQYLLDERMMKEVKGKLDFEK